MKIFKHLKSDWFRYGFEALAVIVGILAAFALDNWNDERKQEKIEIQNLNGLISDLANDTAYYNRRIQDSEWTVEHHPEFIRLMYQEQKSIEEVKTMFRHIQWNSEHLTTQNSTYIELTYSGALSIISNPSLKEMIINYYRENERAATHIREFNEFSTRHVVDMASVVRNYFKMDPAYDGIYENIDISYDGEWEFINDSKSEQFRTTEYAVILYKYKHEAFLNYFRSLKEMSTLLIRAVQQELESRK